MISTSAAGIQIGARTHNHDQVIVPVNFRTRKMRKRTVQMPMPPVEVLLFIVKSPLV
jgi:ribosomal protein L11